MHTYLAPMKHNSAQDLIEWHAGGN